MEPTQAELAIVDEISHLGADAWTATLAIEGLNTDPVMFSAMIYRRLWSNHRGFLVLWKANLLLEASIVLRSGLEASICLAALPVLGGDFIALMKKDAAFTVRGQQIKLLEDGDEAAAQEAGAHVDMLLSLLPEGTKPEKLKFKTLAETGGVPQLYSAHRMLSGTSSHVTGLSVLQGSVSDNASSALQAELTNLTRRMHLMYMAGATLHGIALHCQMIDALELLERANRLIGRMNEISRGWA
jgi:hypothetical protein